MHSEDDSLHAPMASCAQRPDRRRRAVTQLAGAALLGGAWPLARAAGVVRVGQSLPLTGPLGAVVGPVFEGQRALLEEVNARGGVYGNRIELITLDDAADAQQTADNARRLIERDRVTSLFGFAVVQGTLRTLPLLAQYKVPLIGLYSGSDIVRETHQPYLFTTTASIRDEVVQMVRTLNSQHSTRFALVYQNNELGRYMLPLVKAIAKEHNASLTVSTPVEPDGSNAQAAAQAVGATQPQAILLLAAGAAALGFMKVARDVARAPVYTLSLAGTTSLLDRLGPAAHGLAVTQIVPYPGRQTSSLTRQFAAAMQKARLAPTYDRMWGYLNASILAEVLRRAGPEPTPAGIIYAIERMNNVDLGGYRLSFDATNHHGSRFVEITMVGPKGEYIR
jgi:branched-chain amino acid transport system substrate-binding protein